MSISINVRFNHVKAQEYKRKLTYVRYYTGWTSTVLSFYVPNDTAWSYNTIHGQI